MVAVYEDKSHVNERRVRSPEEGKAMNWPAKLGPIFERREP